MPADVSYSLRPASPIVADDKSGKKDKNFRRYASAVERALSLFDNALHEWADYISFLGRLLKALQTRPPGVNEVPSSNLVAKRLSQCLSPMLPSGVHQKALEVYGVVFAILSKDRLAEELFLYLPGLSPLLSFASLTVKPALLSLFETFIVNLDTETLQPALKAIALALLPGLEEEASEEFERTHALLNKFRGALGSHASSNGAQLDIKADRYFWQSLFLATITSPSRRQGALSYLERNLPLLGDIVVEDTDATVSNGSEASGENLQLPPELEAVASPEPGLLIRCFAAGLQDEQLLTQRGFLDLLVTHLPLNSVLLQRRVLPEDLELLVSAAASVVARREMSLNRRLWTWFLGQAAAIDADESEPNSPESDGPLTTSKTNRDFPVQYFKQHGLDPLVKSLLHMLNNSSLLPSAKARPFRICLSLMDRWEIGGLVVPRIFRPAMESIHRYEQIAPSQDSFSEVLRSANVFFDGIQSRQIWKELVVMISETVDPQILRKADEFLEQAQRQIDLAWFIVSKFDIREEDMLALHLPNTMVLILASLRNQERDAQSPDVRVAGLIQSAYRIAAFLLDLIPKRVFATKVAQPELSSAQNTGQDHATEGKDMPKMIKDFYNVSDHRDDNKRWPFPGNDLGTIVLPISADLVKRSLENTSHTMFLEVELSLLNKLIKKAQSTLVLNAQALLTSLALAVEDASEHKEIDAFFPRVFGLVATVEVIFDTMSTRHWQSDHSVRQVITKLIACLWAYISPARPRHSVEAVRCLWRIHQICPNNQLAEAAITSLMLQDQTREGAQDITIDGTRRFATLWTHSLSVSNTLGDHRPNPTRTDFQIDRKLDKSNYDTELLVRPLLLVLESLNSSNCELSIFISDWLQSLPNVLVVLEILIRLLDTTPFLLQLWSRNSGRLISGGQPPHEVAYEADQTVYYLEMLQKIVLLRSPQILSSLKVPITVRALAIGKSHEQDAAGESRELPHNDMTSSTIHAYMMQVSMAVFRHFLLDDSKEDQVIRQLRQLAIALLRDMLSDLDLIPSVLTELETLLIESLSRAVEHSESTLQIAIMECLEIVLKKRLSAVEVATDPQGRTLSKEYRRSISQSSLSPEKSDVHQSLAIPVIPDNSVLDCLIFGLSSQNSRPILEKWTHFLDICLPLYASNTFQVILPLVGCICRSIDSVFQSIENTFEEPSAGAYGGAEPIHSLNVLFTALEHVLARGHDQIVQDEAISASLKSPEQVQGFFGSMVSALGADTQAGRSATANKRLTVLLCFKDAVKISLKLWSWGDDTRSQASRESTTSASFNYASVRLRNRSRRVLENLFTAESLECLETLVDAWQSQDMRTTTIMNLLHTLEAARPKNTMPTIFNAIYSRTNPNVLDPGRKSTLTSELSDVQLAAFLVAYTKSMDDDALDEVWNDCMTFSRDVLGNPLPHRQTLALLLEFIAALGEKIDNTNFGEQRRMRREIGDLFVRLLAAMFTIKPLSFPQYLPAVPTEDKQSLKESSHKANINSDAVAIIASIMPKVAKILIETDRMTPAITTISSQIFMPTFHWKTFPHNVSVHTVELLKVVSRVAEASKTWRKDVAEAYNDPRFFATRPYSLIESGWMPILRRWALVDKERMPDCLSRLTSPTSAGIMFGVGASSARLEADRKAQLNLRRLAFHVLSADDDTFVVNMSGVQDKLAELMNATAASSPSSVTRAEVYMVLRALILKNAPVHLASLWPIINTELYAALSSIDQIASRETYNITCILQAAKLLDTLLIIAPDDFQLREWLYITDTIDAVYRPPNWRPVALIDELAESLDHKANFTHNTNTQFAESQRGVRKPLLRWDITKGVPRENLMDQVLRPFLRQLSINHFESTYQMESPDRKACRDELLRDLFDDSTLV